MVNWTDLFRGLGVDALKVAISGILDLQRPRFSKKGEDTLEDWSCQKKQDWLKWEVDSCRSSLLERLGCIKEKEVLESSVRLCELRGLAFGFLCGLVTALVVVGGLWLSLEKGKRGLKDPVRGEPVRLVFDTSQKSCESKKDLDRDGSADETVAAARRRARALQG